MISSDRSYKRLVAGNYDVIINESIVSNTQKSILINYLKHFERYETELGQHHQYLHQRQQQQRQQLQLQEDNDTVRLQPDEFSPLVPPNCGYINEFKLLKELSKSLKENKANLVEGETEENQRKNRYKDIIPFSHTRVILSCNPAATWDKQKGSLGDQSGYINANYIRGPSGSTRAYIACQGPLVCTLNDFWRMIWECNVSVVVMACNEHESGKPKCELYWPDQIDASHTYGNIQVTLLRVRQINSDFLIRKFSVKLLAPAVNRIRTANKSTRLNHQMLLDGNNNNENSINNSNFKTMTSDNNNYPLRPTSDSPASYRFHTIDTTAATTKITNSSVKSKGKYVSFNSNGNCSTSSESISTSDDSTCIGHNQQQHYIEESRPVLMERTICQFHYTTWPDHGVPDSVHPILELVRLIREVQPAEDKPILVHCSAGCGRTGTICCIDYVWGLLRQGKLDQNFNLCNIISEMRQQRMAMVQTIEQYILCHRAVAALFMQHLQLISLDDEGTHKFEKSLLDMHHTSSSIEDSAIEDNGKDVDEEEDAEGDDEENDLTDQDEEETDDAELGPVFI